MLNIFVFHLEDYLAIESLQSQPVEYHDREKVELSILKEIGTTGCYQHHLFYWESRVESYTYWVRVVPSDGEQPELRKFTQVSTNPSDRKQVEGSVMFKIKVNQDGMKRLTSQPL
mmetsp:Transcript_1168/g.1236  ORF Transcript_1168/g.1236 Transcript_1168/m.1236 type:complete len:115 (+) Transcript_1168:262-606(+)